MCVLHHLLKLFPVAAQSKSLHGPLVAHLFFVMGTISHVVRLYPDSNCTVMLA